MFSRIVVPLDGSSLSERAIPLAREMAARTGGSLRLVRVHVPPRIPATCHQVLGPRVGGELKRSREAARERDRRYLEEARAPAEGVSEAGGPAVSTALLRGPEGHSIVDEVRRSDASLVVLSVPVPGVDEPDRLDGPRNTVVRACPIPVLIVRADDTSPGDEAAVPTRMLVPLDGSGRSESALRPTAEMARLFGTPVTLMRVMRCEGPAADRGTDAMEGPSGPAARAYLRALAGEPWADGLEVDTVVEHGDPAEAILRTARARRADLVAMASRCRGPLTRLVLGSVADRVMRRTSASVLVVNPDR